MARGEVGKGGSWSSFQGHIAPWAVFSAACISNVPVEAPTAEVAEYPSSEFDLANGMRLVLERGPDDGVAAVVLVVGTGSADEAVGKAGIAHLTEHLVFQTRGEGELPLGRRLEARAASANGWTDWDATTYAADVPVASLEQTLGILAAVLERPLAGVTEADFARELSIVQSERRLHLENGTHYEGVGRLTEAVFPESFPYAHPVAGTEQSLKNLSLADAQHFARAGYLPQRATLAVSAPLEFGAQLELVRRAFGPLARDATKHEPASIGGAAPPLRPAAAPALLHESLVATPTLLIGWPVPTTFAERAVVLDLIERMVDGTLAWDSELRDVVVDGSASFVPGVRGNLFYVEVTLDALEDDSPSAIQALVERVAERVRRGIYSFITTADLFERYKRYAAVDHTYSFEALSKRAVALATSRHYLSSSSALVRRDRELRALTEADVKDYVATYLTDERARAVVLRPPSAASESWQPTAVSALSAGSREPLALPPLAAGEKESWVRGLDARKMRTGTLANGMSIVVANRPGAVYHTVLVGFAGGEGADDAPGVSIAEPWALWRNDFEPSVQGLTIERYHESDASVELVRSTGTRVDVSLAALRRWLDDVNLNWPPREFLERLNNYGKQDAQPARVLAREVRTALFGTDPWGRFPTSEQVGAVQANDIHRFRGKVLRPKNGVLVIVGDIDPERGLALGEELMGSWSKFAEHEPKLENPKPVAAGAPRRIERDWPRSTRAQIGVSCLLDVSTPQRSAVVSVLDGLIRRRLYAQLREQLGASYAVFDRTHFLRGGTGVIDLAADVSYDHFTAASAATEAFARGDVSFSAEELERDQRAFAASYNQGWSRTDSLARALFRAWVQEGGIEGVVTEPERYFGVQLADVNAAARECSAHAVQSLLADMKQIERIRRAAPAPGAHPAQRGSASARP